MTKKCTFKIFATVEYFKYNGKLRCPVYSFVYNDQVYSVSDNVYSNIGVPSIGTNLEIKINPDKPEDFLNNKKFFVTNDGIFAFNNSGVFFSLYFVFR